jgi:hypothetical protein
MGRGHAARFPATWPPQAVLAERLHLARPQRHSRLGERDATDLRPDPAPGGLHRLRPAPAPRLAGRRHAPRCPGAEARRTLSACRRPGPRARRTVQGREPQRRLSRRTTWWKQPTQNSYRQHADIAAEDEAFVEQPGPFDSFIRAHRRPASPDPCAASNLARWPNAGSVPRAQRTASRASRLSPRAALEDVRSCRAAGGLIGLVPLASASVHRLRLDGPLSSHSGSGR